MIGFYEKYATTMAKTIILIVPVSFKAPLLQLQLQPGDVWGKMY